ncbi:hypothetical protein TpMuguga_04g02645 [Theileria parva strain Muguga]|uniref:uncharacterized protein n=1 Tax=Theileria parva strain Muguga TaxID=333668 RepID=UPI001C61F6BA|nr:uncharacterized protein TpMuguga_04g02645 [Theileria parva strain Muguga]KAF5153182.1 hypothetical protein TpMuguga_04g02645 [Theileria parva strain Muguga]
MPRGRKKIKTNDEQHITHQNKYNFNHKAFEVISNQNIEEDCMILEKFGVPIPPKVLNLNLGPGLNQFSLVMNVFSKYSEFLLKSIEDSKDERFLKRKVMFTKLVKAVNLKFICSFRWKYFDILLLKRIDRSSFGINSNVKNVKEYLKIYKSLWQEHCKSMQRLLGEWNEATCITKVYGLEQINEANISSVVSKLNELVEECTSQPDPYENRVEDNAELNQKSASGLLREVIVNDEYKESLEVLKSKIESARFTRINQLQLMVNRIIGKYEDLLNKVETYNDSLVKLSACISEKMFSRMSIKEYVKLIQEMPHMG